MRKDRDGGEVRRTSTRSVIERRSANENNDLFRIGHSKFKSETFLPTAYRIFMQN